MYVHVHCTQGLPEQVGVAVAAHITNTCQESLRSIVPAFERTCTEMMKQIDENFRRGTQDCKLKKLSHNCIHVHVVFPGLMQSQPSFFEI